MYKMDFNNADRIIAISETDREEIRRYYPKYAEKVVKIYNPIKVKDAHNRKNVVRNNNIVAVNLQFHHKNVITLIKAFEKCKDLIEGNLILIGSMPKRVGYLSDYVEKHNLAGRVVFTGFVPGEQKRRLLSECGLYVNCSLFEGFGMTAVEAMIMRTPTLLSKIPANYEVTAGLCNYYEPVDSVDALAEAIVKCLKEQPDTEKLEQGRQAMLELYDYRTIAGIYMELFRECMNE
jgi:glycosyltransferase involved in cell wall biosynthesis